MITAGDLQSAWRALPLGTLTGIIGSGTCLILAPHPDDESLGCGGLIAACVAAGKAPLVVILTDGTGSHPNSHAYPPDRLRAVRAREALDAVECLGLPPTRVVFLDVPDRHAPQTGPGFQTIVSRLTDLIGGDPDYTAILAPWLHDPHCDHEASSLAAAATADAVGVRHVAYPVWGWTLPPETPVPTRFDTGWRLDVSDHLSRKRRAILAHRSQYGGLITDDPTAFRLPPALLAAFDTPFETFLLP